MKYSGYIFLCVLSKEEHNTNPVLPKTPSLGSAGTDLPRCKTSLKPLHHCWYSRRWGEWIAINLTRSSRWENWGPTVDSCLLCFIQPAKHFFLFPKAKTNRHLSHNHNTNLQQTHKIYPPLSLVLLFLGKPKQWNTKRIGSTFPKDTKKLCLNKKSWTHSTKRMQRWKQKATYCKQEKYSTYEQIYQCQKLIARNPTSHITVWEVHAFPSSSWESFMLSINPVLRISSLSIVTNKGCHLKY